jgi:hypothetical protein
MKRLMIVLALLLAASALMFAGGKKEATGQRHVVVATDSTWPPMEFVNEQKEIVGKYSVNPCMGERGWCSAEGFSEVRAKWVDEDALDR